MGTRATAGGMGAQRIADGGGGRTIGHLLPRARAAWRRATFPLTRRRIAGVLRSPVPAIPYDDDAIFWPLQREFAPRDSYRYGARDLWQRASTRTQALLDLPALREPGARVLEAGCGDGMTGYLLRCYGHAVTLTDIADWRDRRARGLDFVRADLCAGVALAPDRFDLVCSYNTFEHLDHPDRALDELVRVCKPGGLVRLQFGPLYASAWGLHAYKTLTIPYAQFLFSPAFIADKLRMLGIRDLGVARETLQPLNRWRVAGFSRLWERADCDVIAQSARQDRSGLALIDRFPRAFTGRGLTFADVATKQLAVTLRKRGAA